MSAAASCIRCIIQLHHADDASYRCCIKQLLLHCQLLHHVSCCICQMLHQATAAASCQLMHHVSCCIMSAAALRKQRGNLKICPDQIQILSRTTIITRHLPDVSCCIMPPLYHTAASIKNIAICDSIADGVKVDVNEVDVLSKRSFKFMHPIYGKLIFYFAPMGPADVYHRRLLSSHMSSVIAECPLSSSSAVILSVLCHRHMSSVL